MKIIKVWVCRGCEPNCRISADFVGPNGPEVCPGCSLDPEHKKCKISELARCRECLCGHKRKFVLEEVQSLIA